MVGVTSLVNVNKRIYGKMSTEAEMVLGNNVHGKKVMENGSSPHLARTREWPNFNPNPNLD